MFEVHTVEVEGRAPVLRVQALAPLASSSASLARPALAWRRLRYWRSAASG